MPFDRELEAAATPDRAEYGKWTLFPWEDETGYGTRVAGDPPDRPVEVVESEYADRLEVALSAATARPDWEAIARELYEATTGSASAAISEPALVRLRNALRRFERASLGEGEGVWFCKIGEADPFDVPNGADGPMREAVARTYRRITGQEPKFIFSGWGAELTEEERAVVEHREPVYEKTEWARARRLEELEADAEGAGPGAL